MRVLIVDDSSTKIANIIKVIKETVNKGLQVETVLDSVSAQRILRQTNFDLLLIDFLLPIRSGERPIESGGKQLVNEIERKRTLNSPKYIVGITQYEEHIDRFPEIWNSLHYSNSSEWKKKLKRIISHIKKVKESDNEYKDSTQPSIIVEGHTDKQILCEAIEVFNPELKKEVTVKSDKNAGANWVSNQIIAWAHSKVGGTNKKIKAIGLLDGDEAGNNARDEVYRLISTDSAMQEIFKIICLSPDYARDVIPLYKQGLLIPITLEELFPPNIWEIANENNWLIDRDSSELTLKDPSKWDKMQQSLNDFITSLGLPEEQMLYLKKVRNRSKEDLVNYICDLKDKEKEKALINFESIINDFEGYLFE